MPKPGPRIKKCVTATIVKSMKTWAIRIAIYILVARVTLAVFSDGEVAVIRI